MTCAELRRYLSLHLDSELSPETAADLERHVETCASCAERVRAEERLEHKIRKSLRGATDAEAWNRAIASFPRPRRWAFPLAAGAAAAAILAILLWPRGHQELDLAAALAKHHSKYVSGHSPLGAETSDPAEASRYLQAKLGFPCRVEKPLPSDVRLIGARLCYLEGAPTGFYFLHSHRRVVTVAVVAREDLARFPVARGKLDATGEVHCTVEGKAFVLVADGKRAVTAVGEVPAEELAKLARLFVGS